MSAITKKWGQAEFDQLLRYMSPAGEHHGKLIQIAHQTFTLIVEKGGG